MSKSLRKLAFFGILSVFLLSSLVAQQALVDKTRATGAIPLTAEQLEKVLTTWPRVDRVNFNRIGRERINRVKALKGETLLPLSAVKAIGRETEISIHPAGTPDTPFVLNETLLGDLPVYVDNSTDTITGLHFPPIRSQGSLGACAAWASTYYQLSYMTALQRGLDIRNNEDNTNKYSPKWSYNLLNNGVDGGSDIVNILNLLEHHGAVTWAEFPYDGTDYRAWCLDTNAWRNALSVRTEPAQFSWHTDTDAGLEVIKQLLANGYILTFNTDIYAWQIVSILDNPSSTDDTSAVGKAIGYWVNTTASGHSMTIVGYNDSIWTDINGNSTMDAGELGALRIANSWGTAGWYPPGYPDDGGFIWLAYDALKGVSAVPGGPSTGREAAFWNNFAYVQTARNGYSPSLIAEFTVNHLKRNQLTLSLGTSATTATTPSALWTPMAFYQRGGAYAFDGTEIAVDGTFVLDYSNILPSTGDLRRFYLRMNDSTSGDMATLSAFKIIDYTTDPDTEVVYSGGTQTADLSTIYPFVEHTYTGPTRNTLPLAYGGYVTPVSGTDLQTYYFIVWYYDADKHVPSVKNVYIDGTAYTLTYFSGSGSASATDGWYRYYTTLPVGNHNYRFYFEDGHGGSGQDPITTDPPDYYTYEGPTVALAHVVTTPVAPSGEQSPVMGLSYTYSTSGSACHQGHDIQYQFDWGDGTTSDWLAVGVTSAQRTWNSSGIFSVKAQARCTENNAILSSWSSGLLVSVVVTPLLSQSFPASSFPTGWTQQVVGTTNRWTVVNSANAGGQAYEMRYTISSVTGVARLVTPAIDTTGRSALFLNFKHFMDAFTGGGAWVKIQTSPDRTNWTDEAWVVPVVGTTNIGPETVFTTVTHNLNITTTYVAFTVEGNLGAVFYWYVDDVSIGAGPRSAKRKVDFNKDGQEDLLWRCYGTSVMNGVTGDGWDVVWFMGQTGALSPIKLAGTQNGAGAMNRLTGSIPSKTYLSPMEVGRSRTARPERVYLSPMDVGNPRSAGPVKTYISPLDVGIPLTPKQKTFTRGAVDLSRKLSRGDSMEIRGRDLKSSSVLQDMGRLAAGDAKTMALDYSSDALLYTVLDLAWEIAGAGDFDGDGNTDILWRYYGGGQGRGMTVIWYMNGTTISSQGYPYLVSDTDWRIDRTGDFNGDGKTDILWRYYGSGPDQPHGMTVIWCMDGANIIDQVYPYRVSDTDWKIDGIGDFNGDGKADILWRYYGTGPGQPQGMTVIWYMDGTTILSQGYPYLVSDTDWKVDGTGDFNGDGRADIVWRYYGAGEGSGTTIIWYMDGATILGQAYLYRVTDLNWRIVNR